MSWEAFCVTCCSMEMAGVNGLMGDKRQLFDMSRGVEICSAIANADSQGRASEDRGAHRRTHTPAAVSTRERGEDRRRALPTLLFSLVAHSPRTACWKSDRL